METTDMKTAEASIIEKVERWEKKTALEATGYSTADRTDKMPVVKTLDRPAQMSQIPSGLGFLDIQILKSIGALPEPSGQEKAQALLSRIKRNAQYMVDLVKLDLASQEDLSHIAKNIAIDAEQIAVSSARLEKRDVMTFASVADID